MMDVTAKTCPHCNKVYSSPKVKNEHIKKVHKMIPKTRKCRIICPLCEGQIELKTFENLRGHLADQHQVSCEQIIVDCSSNVDYEAWKQLHKIETGYSLNRTIQLSGHKEIHYECNRSNSTGYESKCVKRTEKAGGSIKIRGMCPSKLIVKIYEGGNITVNFWKTHAGHEENELRCKHLSTTEKNVIVNKLKSGVPVDRILEDARKLETSDIQRINLLSRMDVDYLARKFNIENRRDQNEMVAAALKVEEWNANGKNFAFFFKQEGSVHEVLRKEDFALGFMNSTMEDKLKNFSSIICMDGTHGTNRKGLDLTTMLIKDDKNVGFPVAFFLSNRLDQHIQEVFLGALKNKIGQEIAAEYFMSDDDPKYYNAWRNTMKNKPRRLLCTWHVVKNWNIQGKKKIKSLDLRNQMKFEMRRILNETNEENFLKLVEEYFRKLEVAKEEDFRNYLLKNYFQNQERIQMWAHCYRTNARINTNMANESLNNLLKTNQLKRKTNITVEKLLDKIEDLVDIKMWQRILNMQRPNANNYQDRIIIKAHKKAEATKDKVSVINTEFGEFQIKASGSDTLYNIKYKQLCENNCKTLFCRVCKICIHRYECDCREYAVKNTLCKHVHLVRMYEERKGTNSVLDEAAEVLGQQSQIKIQQAEISIFLEEQQERDQENKENKSGRNIQWLENVVNMVRSLDKKDLEAALMDKNLEEFAKNVGKMVEAKHKTNSKKRKMEKQEYFSTKKKKLE